MYTGQSRLLQRTRTRALAIGCIAAAGLFAGCQNANPADAVADLFRDAQPADPSEVARDAFNVYDADKRRRAINRLATADWGGQAPYLRTYRLLLDDPDATVRAAAVSALGRHGTVSDVPRVIARLSRDADQIVRWEAARALQKMHDERAIDPLIKALNDDAEMDVRQAAAIALGQYPRRRVFSALVAGLNDEDFGVAHASEQSLMTLTGKDLGDRSEAWWTWAQDNDALFADQQTYYYPAYRKPPGLMDRVAFWSEREPSERRRPRTAEQMQPPPEPVDEGPAPALQEPGEEPDDRPAAPPQRQPTERQPRTPDEPDQPRTPDIPDAPDDGDQPAPPSTPDEPDQPAAPPDEPDEPAQPTRPADGADDAEPADRPRRPRPVPDHPLGASG